MPLQTWPGQECISACSGFIQLLGCPEAFPASLQHTPGPKAPKRFPMRHLTGASPPVGTHLKSPAGCSMLREVRSQHLWQTRSRSPSSFLAPGGQIIKWGGGLARLGTQRGEATGMGAQGTQSKPLWEPGGAEWGELGGGSRHGHPHSRQEQSEGSGADGSLPSPRSCLCTLLSAGSRISAML